MKEFAWRRPTLPGPCGPSTIGAGGLNGRVRDGYAWNPSAIATKRDLLKLASEITYDTEIVTHSVKYQSCALKTRSETIAMKALLYFG